ncbi:hypothetical protein CSA37_12345 [Candidatus Fermentibacteria bacterium]|nr:MAG: hypothetical protein CSA37_12345 [Candidatus Fermentibacteria bacterium]
MLVLTVVFSVTAFAMTDGAPTISLSGGEADAMWDEIANYDLEAGGIPNAYTVGCGWDGTYFWVTNGAGMAGAGTGMFYLFSSDGMLVDDFPQFNAPGWGLRDLCFDGTYIYGSDDNQIDYYDITSHEKVGAFTSNAVNPNRALAYDGTDFYTGSFSEVIYQLTWDGVSGSTATHTNWSSAATSTYGAAWDSANNCLWVTSANGSGIIAQIAADGSLVENHTVIADGTYGGATMRNTSPVVELFVLEQGSPDALRGYDVTDAGGALSRDSWGAIKSLF